MVCERGSWGDCLGHFSGVHRVICYDLATFQATFEGEVVNMAMLVFCFNPLVLVKYTFKLLLTIF